MTRAALVPAAVVLTVACSAVARGLDLAVVVLAALIALAARRLPAAALPVLIVLVVVVPVYGGRTPLGRSLVLVPATVAALVLLPSGLQHLREIRLGALDWAYASFILIEALAALVNTNKPAAGLGLVWRFLMPYVAWRLVAARGVAWRAVSWSLVGSAGVLAALAISEGRTGDNVFRDTVPATYSGAIGAVGKLRFGQFRAQSSFGEPITFGIFLGLGIALAVGLIITADHLVERALAVAAIALMGPAQLATGSRVALLVTALGVAFQIRQLTARRARRTAAVLLMGFLAAALVSGLGHEVQNALSTLSGDSREAQSASFRTTIFDLFTDPGQYTLLGKGGSDATGLADLAVQTSGLKSLDNEYAFLFVTGGVSALVTFALLPILLGRDLVLGRARDPLRASVAAGLLAVFVGLLVVALLNQLADLVGILLALLAATRAQAPAPPRPARLAPSEPAQAGVRSP